MDANRFRSLSIASAVLLSGCVLFQPAWLEPDAQSSVVRSGPWGKVYRGGYVQVVNVNGVEPSFSNQREVAVPPGEQRGVLWVSLCDSDSYKRCYTVNTAQIDFRTEPGRSYVARAQEKVHGSNAFWVWVEEQDTHAVVGGERPPAPRSAKGN
jgi:hypothetical protein